MQGIEGKGFAVGATPSKYSSACRRELKHLPGSKFRRVPGHVHACSSCICAVWWDEECMAQEELTASSAELNCCVILRQSHALLLCSSLPTLIFLQPKSFPGGSPKYNWVLCVNTLLTWLGINGFLHPCKHIHLAMVDSELHQGQGYRNISTPTHTQGRRWRLREPLTGIVSLKKLLKFHSALFSSLLLLFQFGCALSQGRKKSHN